MNYLRCLISVITVTICVVSSSAERDRDREPFRFRFSIVALPFRFNGISPKYVDPAPRELLEVSE